MAQIPWAEIEGHRAAAKLAEGDTAPTAEILRGDMELSWELRNTIADMLDGQSSNNTRLVIKSANGRIKQSTLDRDLEIFYAVEAEMANRQCSIEDACLNLSGIKNVGEESIRKAYQRAKVAINNYDKASHEARQENG